MSHLMDDTNDYRQLFDTPGFHQDIADTKEPFV